MGKNILRVVLILSGLFIVFTGLNVALGGVMTMGWQGTSDFVKVTNEHAYLIRDSHTRFYGGVWVGMGLLFILSTLDLEKYLRVLQAMFVFIFIGGLARLGQMRFEVIFSADLIGSVFAELIGMPILFIWLGKAVGERNDK
ncbi:MAG: DUF4345 domain-containing protein [Anaerolineales bacterium]